MKRIVVLSILCVTLLCACFAVQEDANHISGVTGGVVSGCSTEAVGIASGAVVSSSVASVEEKTKPWIITDMNGKKRELKIGNVNTEDVEVEIEPHSVAVAHSQVLDDHYYYVRKEGDRKYTFYRDKGYKVGSFKIGKKDSFVGCAVYDGQFYVLLDNEKSDAGQWFSALAVADFSREKLTKLDITPDWNMYFYQNQIYKEMDYNERNNNKMEVMDIKGNRQKIISFPDQEPISISHIIDGRIYYVKEDEREVKFFRLDPESRETEEIFHYESSVNFQTVNFQMDKGGFFIEEKMKNSNLILYTVPWSGKKMLKVTKVNATDYCYNSRFVFYMDKSSQIHRWNRKTQKEDRIIQTKIHKDSFLDCTEEGLYIQECTDENHNLYFLDSDGRKPEKIWDDKNYIEEDWEKEDDGDEDYKYTYW